MAAVSRMSNPERVVITAVLAGVKGQRRPKQAGSIAPDDNRYCASERDAATGKFIGKKARSIFTSVFEPRGKLLELSEHLREDDPSKINMHPPRISRTTVELALQEDYDDDSKCARVGGAGAAPSDRAIHEDGIPDSGSSEGGS